MKKTGYLALSFLTAGVAHAAVYDLGTNTTVTFDSSVDTLTNTGGITAWDNTTLKIDDGSNLAGVDFTALGVTTWSAATFNNSPVTNFDGADLSGLQINLIASSNNFRDDSFIGTNFSGATITTAANQPFVSVGGTNLQNANFTGATLNFSHNGAFGFNTYGSDLGGNKLAGADFSNSIWVYTGTSDGDPDAFNLGAGSSTIADKGLAADFSGADFSGVADATTMGEIIANLGLFDTGTAIGAKYDANTVLPTGFTTADLDAAGWQAPIPEPSSTALIGFAGLALLGRRKRS